MKVQLYLLVLITSTVHWLAESTSGPCTIQEQEGFLQNVCDISINSATYKCAHSKEFYNITHRTDKNDISNICSNDPHFYQACNRKIGDKVTNTATLCENYLCNMTLKGNPLIWTSREMELMVSNPICNGRLDCKNTDLDEVGCDVTTLPSGKKVSSNHICNDECDIGTCEDEAMCNGYTYGIYCNSTVGTVELKHYVPPLLICKGVGKICDNGADEAFCSVTNETENVCRRHPPWSSNMIGVPVLNFTRCSVLIGNTAYTAYCENHFDQTNCSDPFRVGVDCRINGFQSTVSKYMICLGEKICDDNIENDCLKTSKACPVIHKHFMCDKKDDCEDGSDESHPICNSQTKVTCKRKVGRAGNLNIPRKWIADGVEDCIDGVDENRSVWKECGQGRTFRLVSSDEECDKVFVCPWGEPSYADLMDLCDGIETCGNEKEICASSRSFPKLSKMVSSANKGLTKQLSFCRIGLKNMHILPTQCTEESFMFPDHDYFGVDYKTTVILPNRTENCDHMYGEQYLYTSCTNRCVNSACPLRNVPRYEVCPGQFPNRVGTVVNNEYLAFFTRSFGSIYTNRYFVCDNKINCIDFSKVCDLVDDCGDHSDEANCTNHFKCNSGRSARYIPVTKQCDGTIDCVDLSDECNENCFKPILEGAVLKGVAWGIGLLAVIANIIIIIKSLHTLGRSKNTVVLANKSLVILIALGDFFVGCYLVTIAAYDGIVYKDEYCTRRSNWLTSPECSAIGVINTIGSQISLFSMTVLSFVRLYIIWNSKRIPGKVNTSESIQVLLGVVLLGVLSIVLAIIPIIRRFEDFFVNGVKYSDELRLFIGTSDKDDVVRVLNAYHGRMRKATLSWSTIHYMVSEMYSHLNHTDHTLLGKLVQFYGNDGVCLFKYFVDRDDPQRNFVWGILTLNFLCFIFISTSYLLIALLSSKSSKNLSSTKSNKQALKRNRKMNQRIAFIITTDFICWIPFIVICIAHSLELLDAEPYYSLLSMIVLPINSVINPLIYDETVTRVLGTPVNRLLTLLPNILSRVNTVRHETIELDCVTNQTKNVAKDTVEKDLVDEKREEALNDEIEENVGTSRKGSVKCEATEENIAISRCDY